jgi:hypothetical protein
VIPNPALRAFAAGRCLAHLLLAPCTKDGIFPTLKDFDASPSFRGIVETAIRAGQTDFIPVLEYFDSSEDRFTIEENGNRSRTEQSPGLLLADVISLEKSGLWSFFVPDFEPER